MRQVIPLECEIGVAELVDAVRSAPVLEPFSEPVVEFCAALAQAISRSPDARRYPELQALAFWMRRSALQQLAVEFRRLESDDVVLAPRGLVFHLPPGNVDTIFLYSWLLAVLGGNRNVLRLSRRESPQVDILCALYRDTLAQHTVLQNNTAVVRYGHETEITAALSAVCDMRVIWGGDEAVRTIRTIPIPPHARELTFPDRFSLCAMSAQAVVNASETEVDKLADSFHNDVYWFDQAACSSPRLLVWTGEVDTAANASERFAGALSRALDRRGVTVQPGLGMQKLTFSYRAAIDRPVVAYRSPDSRLMLLTLGTLEKLEREHCGGGLLFECRVNTLGDVAVVVGRKDQTLTHYGFAADELRVFARRLNGRGIDRMVPVGRALDFHRFWDGHDLLQEFVRRVHVSYM
jgi:hypothetical protein